MKRYFFPDLGVSVDAESREEAEELVRGEKTPDDVESKPRRKRITPSS